MRAVILAGGQGTRLLPYTTVLPKPLVPVGERPILELLIRQLAAHGIDQVDLCIGHLGDLIQAYLSECSGIPDHVNIDYHWEDEPLGTAGALRIVEPADDHFVVMNGDILTDLDYGRLVARHEETNADLTIATHRADVQLSLGVVIGEDESVTGYDEKPTLHYDVSMGIYVYSQRALAAVPEGRFDFPDLVLALLEQDRRVNCFPFSGEWYDIGTPGEHGRAMEAIEERPELFIA
jgi:NDP-sugar pyrophosphorylase family protein